MKINYSNPLVEIAQLDDTDVIATSLPISTQSADNSAQLGDERGNPIWD